jgi:hypothetical protein
MLWRRAKYLPPSGIDARPTFITIVDTSITSDANSSRTAGSPYPSLPSSVWTRPTRCSELTSVSICLRFSFLHLLSLLQRLLNLGDPAFSQSVYRMYLISLITNFEFYQLISSEVWMKEYSLIYSRKEKKFFRFPKPLDRPWAPSSLPFKD